MIGLVSCSKLKLDHDSPAREFYVSPLFQMSVRYALARCSHVYVASAKYGLVDLDDVIDPYDVTVRGMAKREREIWASWVARALYKQHGTEFSEGVALLALAGVEYLDPIIGRYRGEFGPIAVMEPLKGMQIGQRLSWLRVQRCVEEAA